MTTIRVGCAGWTVPKQHSALFISNGSHLTRYASYFNCVEINSSFYRPHRPATYVRWAAAVQEDFLFAVKAPKEVTHERRLVNTDEALTAFLTDVDSLGTKCGPLLFQLPPSLDFNRDVAERFFDLLRSRFSNAAVCEPRHQSWFTSAANQLLERFQIGRVAADPPVGPAMEPGGYGKVIYYRLHGSPRVYYSSYAREALNSLIDKLLAYPDAESVWCIFDNTAAGCAAENAHFVAEQLRLRSGHE